MLWVQYRSYNSLEHTSSTHLDTKPEKRQKLCQIGKEPNNGGSKKQLVRSCQEKTEVCSSLYFPVDHLFSGLTILIN